MNSLPLCSSLCWTSVLLAICLACPGLASPLAAQDTNWTPGMHSGLPSVQEPGRTFDVYIPTGYQQDYEFGFPTLHLSSPGGNPKLKPYFSWADQNDFILIGFNSSKNGPSNNNIAAQELCLKTVNSMKLNRHPHLNFSTGHSGGGQASWLLATRRPVEFSGMLLTGQRGYDNLPPKHISVSYVYGDKEPNREYIEDAIKDLRSNGNLVKFQMVPGAHTSGDIKVRLAMIDWMHQNAFMSNPGISDQERIARFDAEVASADEIADVAERLQWYQALLGSPFAAKSNAAEEMKTKWQALAFEHANGTSEDALKLKRMYELQQHPFAKSAEYYKDLRSTVTGLGKDKTLSNEYRAVKILAKARAAQAKATDARRMQAVLKSFNLVVEKYPDTHSAEDAKAVIESLSSE